MSAGGMARCKKKEKNFKQQKGIRNIKEDGRSKLLRSGYRIKVKYSNGGVKGRQKPSCRSLTKVLKTTYSMCIKGGINGKNQWRMEGCGSIGQQRFVMGMEPVEIRREFLRSSAVMIEEIQEEESLLPTGGVVGQYGQVPLIEGAGTHTKRVLENLGSEMGTPP
ncbi:hypothetical protein C1H46_042359 [Malus baccata]|uniref:Uncharacterized protein n=1 Tax=Malus baccata TaxID=106549 RepID=A0A540KCZ5_MALBA|nr:hypothetical protein C1H46_042359 [Malus baccata]